MTENSNSSELLEASLPGIWIAEHRRIWQMKFINAKDLAQFCNDRGLENFREKGIIQLWQLNASRQALRGNDTMGKSVQKIEEKEGNCDSPNDITRVGCSNACRPPSAV